MMEEGGERSSSSGISSARIYVPSRDWILEYSKAADDAGLKAGFTLAIAE